MVKTSWRLPSLDSSLASKHQKNMGFERLFEYIRLRVGGWVCVGPWYGGVQNVWGEENVPENALCRKFWNPSKRASGLLCRGFLYRKNRALTPEGGGKRTVTRGVQNPFFGRGVIREVFHPPLFSTPPWRPLSVFSQVQKIADTVDTEIKVQLIPRKYFFAFAFVLILIGQMIFRMNDYIDTSPRILLSLSLS